MNDGTRYRVQPCVEKGTAHTAEHLKAQIARGLDSLSVQSRWDRFASPIAHFSDQQLDYLTDLDGKDRVAWCASIERNGAEQGIALARYVRLAADEMTAEFAITVVDDYQGRGIGYAMLQQLMHSACDNGLTLLRGYVLPGNRRMLALAKRAGARLHIRGTDFIVAEIALDGTRLKAGKAPADTT